MELCPKSKYEAMDMSRGWNIVQPVVVSRYMVSSRAKRKSARILEHTFWKKKRNFSVTVGCIYSQTQTTFLLLWYIHHIMCHFACYLQYKNVLFVTDRDELPHSSEKVVSLKIQLNSAAEWGKNVLSPPRSPWLCSGCARVRLHIQRFPINTVCSHFCWFNSSLASPPRYGPAY